MHPVCPLPLEVVSVPMKFCLPSAQEEWARSIAPTIRASIAL